MADGLQVAGDSRTEETNRIVSVDALRGFDMIWIVGAAEEGAEDLYGTDLPDAIAWVLGSEGEGMRRLTRERCDKLVRIPMHGQVESLNVSVAAGVCLFEAVRQRRS